MDGSSDETNDFTSPIRHFADGDPVAQIGDCVGSNDRVLINTLMRRNQHDISTGQLSLCGADITERVPAEILVAATFFASPMWAHRQIPPIDANLILMNLFRELELNAHCRVDPWIIALPSAWWNSQEILP